MLKIFKHTCIFNSFSRGKIQNMSNIKQKNIAKFLCR